MSEITRRHAAGFVIKSLDGTMKLQTLIEFNDIPDDRSEMPTPDATLWHTQIPLRTPITPLDPEAQILILLGLDVLQVHKVRKQCNRPGNSTES